MTSSEVKHGHLDGRLINTREEIQEDQPLKHEAIERSIVRLEAALDCLAILSCKIEGEERPEEEEDYEEVGEQFPLTLLDVLDDTPDRLGFVSSNIMMQIERINGFLFVGRPK